MMGITGFKTKKALKAAVKDGGVSRRRLIEVCQLGDGCYSGDGDYTIVGPSPWDRRWEANIVIKDGFIIKVA